MTKPEATFWDHLEVLRQTLLRCLAFFFCLYPVCYALSQPFLTWLLAWSLPAKLGGMHYFSPLEVFTVRLKLAGVLDLALSYPWLLFQAWRFCAPALYPDEKRAALWWVAGASLLFFGGVVFCALGILPLVMRFAASFANEQMEPLLGISEYLSMVGWMSLAFGAMFQTPILVMLAVRFGLLTPEGIASKRPYVVVMIFLLAAFLTPPDVVSQLVLGLPTWGLFELGLLLSRRISVPKSHSAHA
ncbi:MAG: twin-arginine translocase subunit TatC [Victivallales bacterium]|nr:twin-arginine translocase subunit TatC [Victivallales bacterium]